MRHTAWRHTDTDALMHLETKYHFDTAEDGYHVVWTKQNGGWPINKGFEEYDEAENYARNLVLTYTKGKLW